MASVKKFIAAAIVLFGVVTISRPVVAQTGSSGDQQKQAQLDVAASRADRKALVGANMNLTSSEAAAFWPVYDAYEARMEKIDARHAKEIVDFIKSYQTLSGTDADHKLDEVMAVRQARLDLQKEFIPKFRKAVSSVKTTRFFQIDNKLYALRQCALAQDLPLARPASKTTSE